MSKHIHKDQRFDKQYARDNLNDFFLALAEGRLDDAETVYDEVSGVMCAMMEREERRYAQTGD